MGTTDRYKYRKMYNLRLLITFVSIFIQLVYVIAVTVDVRIFGGVESVNPIPYQVSIQKLQHRKWHHFCGGSIIAPSFIVTAAHCVHNERIGRLSILAGTTKRSADSTRYLVASYIIHPKFVRHHHHDIALVKCKSEIEFNSNVGSINCDYGYYIPNGIRCRVSGWGVMERIRARPFPEDLQTANLWTISNTLCRKFHNISRHEICATGPIDEGTCTGDSGGPLVNWNRTLLIGVVSYGPTHCGTGYPDVFTRISEYSSWIADVVDGYLPDDSVERISPKIKT